MTKKNQGWPGFMADMFPGIVEEARAEDDIMAMVQSPVTKAVDMDAALRGMYKRRGRVNDRLTASVATRTAKGGTSE